jgi:NAD+ synthase (glutamine-hydrolysing)
MQKTFDFMSMPLAGTEEDTGAQIVGATLQSATIISPVLKTEVDLPESAKLVSRSLVTTHQEYRVAIAQISTDPGQITNNTKKIINYIEQARSEGAQLVVFPELAITGYCSMDLLWDRDYLAANIAALQKIREASVGITVVVGFVDVDYAQALPGGRPRLYNSAATIHDQKILSVQDKTLLPDYDIFYENRYFAPPRSNQVVQAGAIKIGTEICEDLWKNGYGKDPTEELVKNGAELVVNLSASPFDIGKLKTRHQLISDTARSKGVPLVYANLVGSFDGYEGEVVFDGRSMVVGRKGEIKNIGHGFSEQLIVTDLYLEKEIELPVVEEVAELHDALVLGIKDYFRRVGGIDKANFKSVYIGLSGGIDSAVVAALAVEALGPDKVIGVTMPTQYNSAETRSDAQLLAQNLGIQFRTASIENQYIGCLEDLNKDPELRSLPEGVADQNIQARLRMLYLMYYANKGQGLVLNTGNKTELALDNCTIYGDMVGGFSVLGDVDKDRVYDLARYINNSARKEIIPVSTIDRVASAELKANQSDAEVMGAAPEKIAPLVRAIIEDKLCLSNALEQFSDQFSPALIQRTFQRIDRSEWKRRQASPGIRVSSHAFGVGRRIPISHGFYNQVKGD